MTETAGRLAKKEDALLLVIDVQDKLLPVIADKEQVLSNTIKLARFAAVIRMPVFVTEQEKLGPTVPELAENLAGAQVFGKITFDCFGEEAFRAAVGLTGRHTLFLCGIEAHICVAQTALSALSMYRIHVIADACSSRSPRNHQIAMDRLRAAGAVITSTEMAMYELLRQAGTPEFKQVLKLVK